MAKTTKTKVKNPVNKTGGILKEFELTTMPIPRSRNSYAMKHPELFNSLKELPVGKGYIYPREKWGKAVLAIKNEIVKGNPRSKYTIKKVDDLREGIWRDKSWSTKSKE